MANGMKGQYQYQMPQAKAKKHSKPTDGTKAKGRGK
jgi:hypothetical protein